MNKKAYIKPLMEEMILETESQMMTASAGTNPYMSSEAASDADGLSNGRRGSWGDLWSGEE